MNGEKCKTCANFGAQFLTGYTKGDGEWRRCIADIFGHPNTMEVNPMFVWEVTYGNAGGMKGGIYVHESFGCIYHVGFDELLEDLKEAYNEKITQNQNLE